MGYLVDVTFRATTIMSSPQRLSGKNKSGLKKIIAQTIIEVRRCCRIMYWS